MLRWVALILLILLIALQFKLWTGTAACARYGDCSSASANRRPRTRSSRQRNDTLSAEVEDLKHGDEAVEERARSELGLIKPGETFYQVVEPAAGSGGRDGAANANGEPLICCGASCPPRAAARRFGADVTQAVLCRWPAGL